MPRPREGGRTTRGVGVKCRSKQSRGTTIPRSRLLRHFTLTPYLPRPTLLPWHFTPTPKFVWSPITALAIASAQRIRPSSPDPAGLAAPQGKRQMQPIAIPSNRGSSRLNALPGHQQIPTRRAQEVLATPGKGVQTTSAKQKRPHFRWCSLARV